MAHTPEAQQDYYAFAEGEEEDEDGGQFSSFEYGYSKDNPLLEGDPTQDEHVYITEEEYDAIKQELNDMLEGRSGNKGAQPSYQDTYMRLMQLEENREWSEQIDDAGGVTEEIINVGGHAQSSGALDPLIDENVYITEAEFETLLNELKEENNWSGGPIPGAETLINNRQLSEEAEEAQGHSYGTEEAAAIVFAEQEVPNTGNDYLERGAVIIRSIVPVIDQNGCIIMEERDTFWGILS